ncbi:hypothetical protein BDM02DRAFT_3113638 [Thelephora ganbajun]|uniref:Uncharacterized protein n=1 Tax=Thelephora ganbajun TaxID=370292 RepID=A0ACB6ZJF1_THEGA|nr:hypothetical protein BDM02DRAFT_3113638 [Thelephora ganbajun]
MPHSSFTSSTPLTRCSPSEHPELSLISILLTSTFLLGFTMKAWASYLDDHELYSSSTVSSVMPQDPSPLSAQSTTLSNAWTTVVSCMKLVFLH